LFRGFDDLLKADRFSRDYSSLEITAMTVQRCLTRGGPQFEGFRRGFLDVAAPDEISLLWEMAWTSHTEPDSIAVLGLLKDEEFFETAKGYLRNQPDIELASAPLRVLFKVFEKDEVRHLIDISEGDASRLTTIGTEMVRRMEWEPRPLSRSDVLGASSLVPLVARLEESFLAEVEDLYGDLAQRLSNRRMTAALGGTPSAHCAECIRLAPDRFRKAVEESFHRGSGMSPAAIKEAMSQRHFLEVLAGAHDLPMLVPAVKAVTFPLSAKLDLLRSYPRGFLAVDGMEGYDDTGVPPALRELRGTVLVKAMTKILGSPPFEGPNAIAYRISRTPELREAFYALLADQSFSRSVIAPAMKKAGVEPEPLMIRVALKSDPFCWNVPAGDATIRRSDAAALVLTRGGEQLMRSPLWAGNDGRSLLVEGLHIPDALRTSSREIGQHLQSFFRHYAGGEAPFALGERRGAPFERTLVAMASPDFLTKDLPLADPVAPRGDQPENAGMWSRRYNEELKLRDFA
jgi:hypothetical protein